MEEVRCVIRRDDRSAVRLHLAGEFGRAAHPELRRSLRKACDRAGRGSVVVDMAEVASIGSECIEVLLVGYTRALRSGTGYEVVNAYGPVRQALAMTGLCEPAVDDMFDSLIALVESVPAATPENRG
ncbi:STAS domain-containing protein [Actinoplanes sp. CA-015351]|uniref:STAS domain-containing protein n=1 Tax=Actinoplanes sp. CA-015351 TaxID=3239897 RepID=UPI003D99471C